MDCKQIRMSRLSLIAGLITGKFASNEGSKVILFDYSEENTSIAGQSQIFPNDWDTQSFCLDRNYVYVLNHSPKHRDKSVLIFERKKFFLGQVEPVSIIANLSRPTCIRCYRGKLYVACYGMLECEPAGIYVYEKKLAQDWVRVECFNQPNLKFINPIGLAFCDNEMFVADHLNQTIKVLDIVRTGEPEVLREIGGASNYLYYPLRISILNDELFVVDHIYHKVNVYSIRSDIGSSPLRILGGDKTNLDLPWAIAAEENGDMYVSSIGERNMSENDKKMSATGSTRDTSYLQSFRADAMGNVIAKKSRSAVLEQSFRGLTDLLFVHGENE